MIYIALLCNPKITAEPLSSTPLFIGLYAAANNTALLAWRPSQGTKLYCLVNRITFGVNNLPRVVARTMTRSESNPRPLDHESNALPLHHRATVTRCRQVVTRLDCWLSSTSLHRISGLLPFQRQDWAMYTFDQLVIEWLSRGLQKRFWTCLSTYILLLLLLLLLLLKKTDLSCRMPKLQGQVTKSIKRYNNRLKKGNAVMDWTIG